ncbi:hypothetical protein [Lacrimispora sp. HJ-01]
MLIYAMSFQISHGLEKRLTGRWKCNRIEGEVI